MASNRPIPQQISATLLALAVSVSLGGVLVEGQARPTAHQPRPAGEARMTQATLLQRLSEAARVLIRRASDQADALRRAPRPAFAAADRSVAPAPTDHARPHLAPRLAHLLNLPPPAGLA